MKAALACGNCGQAMQQLQLAGHYGHTVELEMCAPCHLVWFDPVESAHLSGPGLLALMGHMATAQSLAHEAARPGLHCPHCRGALKTVHNQTRWGRSVQLECKTGRHGAWQTFGQFLTEKGLIRPMSSADRHRALQRAGALHCVNCGGGIEQDAAQCRWCGSVPALVDVARLARALDPEDAMAGHAVRQRASEQSAFNCAACGAAQNISSAWQCAACGATLTATGLAEAHAAVKALEPALLAHANKPSPEMVQRRLAAQDRGMQAQRERTEQMQAEADEALRRSRGWDDTPHAWNLLGSTPLIGRRIGWVVAALLVLWLLTSR